MLHISMLGPFIDLLADLVLTVQSLPTVMARSYPVIWFENVRK